MKIPFSFISDVLATKKKTTYQMHISGIPRYYNVIKLESIEFLIEMSMHDMM